MDHGTLMADRLSDEERAGFQAEIEKLRLEHRDLETAIEALGLVGSVDQIQVQRLKKRKLLVRDRIVFIEDKLTPDIIA
jgi:hypothetical protein